MSNRIPDLHVVPHWVGDVPAIARVHLATRRSAYAHILPSNVLSRMSTLRLQQWWEERLSAAPRPHWMFVAVADLQRRWVEGFVHVGPGEEDGLGELYAIHVHPDAQGHGNGRRLLEAAVRKLESQRYRKARLWVLAANSTAQRFYQRNRWSRVDGLVRTENIEGFAVDEVAYERSLQPRT
jgi:ribosomal protein S18 acetylase RimI-like enzyme